MATCVCRIDFESCCTSETHVGVLIMCGFMVFRNNAREATGKQRGATGSYDDSQTCNALATNVYHDFVVLLT